MVVRGMSIDIYILRPIVQVVQSGTQVLRENDFRLERGHQTGHDESQSRTQRREALQRRQQRQQATRRKSKREITSVVVLCTLNPLVLLLAL